MKRIGIVAAALLLGVTASLAGARGHSAAASPSGEQTIQLTLVKGFFHPVDQRPRGFSPGDMQIFGGRLVSDGQTRGRVQAYCVVVSSFNQECSFTYSLDGGQIAAVVGYGKGLSAKKSSTDPIVGGTGAYEGARGEISDSEAGPRKDDLIIHLIN
jgi:hypothetical protein